MPKAGDGADIQITQVKSTILFTAESGTYPRPPADKAQYTTRQVVEALGGLIQKNVDRIHKNKLLPERAWSFVYEEGRGTCIPLRSL